MLTILDCGGIKVLMAFSIVVLPEAVSPETKVFIPSANIREM